MGAYLIKRLLLIIPTLFGIMVINFAIIQIVPGGPVEQMIAQMTGTAVESTARFSGGGEGENLEFNRFIKLFSNEGVEKKRIDYINRISRYQDHLELYNKIDIALDTFPYNGTTTTFEALWMGIPVITKRGDSHVSSVGASILTNIGLQNFIAKDLNQYIDLAKNISTDLDLNQQEFLLNYMQRNWWGKTKNKKLIEILESIKNNINSNVTPRTSWEVGLLKIKLEES